MKFETARIHFLSDVSGLLSSRNFATEATSRNDFSFLLSLDVVFQWLTIYIVDGNLLDRIRRLSSDWVVGLVAFPFSPTENRNRVVQPTYVRVNTRQWISSHDLLASILFHVQYSTRTIFEHRILLISASNYKYAVSYIFLWWFVWKLTSSLEGSSNYPFWGLVPVNRKSGCHFRNNKDFFRLCHTSILRQIFGDRKLK